MPSKKRVLKDYSYYIRLTKKYYKIRQYENALDCIEFAAKLAYNINFKFADSEIEELLFNISRQLIITEAFTPQKNRYIFYDYYALDNRGLTQQYIRALISWKVEIFFIIGGEYDISNSKDILKELNEYPKAKVYILPKDLSKTDKVKNIAKQISMFMPEKAFIHTAPWDVIGITAWNSFPDTTRYLINITDHAFWLGINCSDYFIEYRNYGYNLSHYLRGIDKSRLLMQPYYAINSSDNFMGLPYKDINKDKIKLFSGGNLYKIYGENGQYMSMMKDILNKYPNTVLYFAGDGNRKPLIKFIKKNNLEDKWILLGNRRDLIHVLKEMDIFIGTYPISGGLITYLAASCKLPIISYTNKNLLCNEVEGIFYNIKPDIKITFTDVDSFNLAIDKLIKNKNYRENMGLILNASLISPDMFGTNLHKLITTKSDIINVNNIIIDTDKIFNLYLEIDNKFIHYYPRLLLNRFIFKLNIFRFLYNLITYLVYYDKSKLYNYLFRHISFRR